MYNLYVGAKVSEMGLWGLISEKAARGPQPLSHHDFSTHNVVYRNPWWTMFEKDGWHAMRPTEDVDGGVCLVIDSEDKVLVVRSFRHPLNEVVIELPRGFGSLAEDGSSLETALREAEEEAGVSLKEAEVIDLGEVCPDSGLLAIRVRLVAAVLPYPMPEIRADLSEVLSAEMISLDELRKMAACGDINDAFTVASIFRLDAWRNNLKRDDIMIEIVDEQEQPVTRFKTSRPEWSFDQYCRNRQTPGWSWRKFDPDRKT
jgi:ADP-ribose pyrophosphatase